MTIGKPKAKRGAAPAEPHNALTLAEQPYVAALPGVNILPPETMRRQRNRTLVRRFVTTGIAIAVVAAVCFGGSVALGIVHQRQLDDIRATNAGLNGQIAKLQPYASYQSSLDNARKTVSTSLSTDLDVGRLLTDLNSVAARYGVTYTQISVTTTSGTTTGTVGGTTASSSATGQCLNPDPFNPSTSIGCITLSGDTQSQANATAFFNQFNSQKGFLNGFISGLTTASNSDGGNKSSFNGTVAFDNAFYSNKYRSYASPLSSLLQGSGSSASTGTTTNAGASAALVRSALNARYPQVLSGVSSSAVSGMVSSVCTAANSGSATVSSLQTIVSTSLNKTVSAADGAGIVGSTISLGCPAALSKVSGLAASSNSTTAPSAGGNNG